MKHSINKIDLTNLIESHLYNELKDESYEVNVKEPYGLMTWNRLDVAFKLIYLEYKNSCKQFAQSIYKEHIRALTLGKYIEPGSLEKNTQEKFITEFNEIFEKISNNGFDAKQSLVPLASDGSIVNGAHRLASALFANKMVVTVNIESVPHVYDYQFFYNRNVPEPSIDMAVSKFIETANNVYIALIWPSASSMDEKLAKLIPNVIYKKDIKFNPNGARNLLIKVYHSETWLGNFNNKFKGVDGKFVECFKNFNPLRVVAFQAESLEKVLSIKQSIRDIFNIGKHSIHITDTKEEAIRVSRLLFNKNSIHFLNYADPYKFTSSESELNKFRNFTQKNQIKNNEILIDGGLLLSLYGLRESKDIDYLSLNTDANLHHQDKINNHDEDLKYHQVNKAVLISDPAYHFYDDDVKFISFHQLYQMKKARGEEKDLNDIKMMDALLDDDTFARYCAAVRQRVYYSKVKLKSKVIELLKVVKLYELVRALYQKQKSKKNHVQIDKPD